MIDGAGQEIGRGAHHARDVATGVDHRVPAAAFEGGEVAVAIAAQPLDPRRQHVVVLATRKRRDAVPARERRIDGMSSEEMRSSQD